MIEYRSTLQLNCCAGDLFRRKTNKQNTFKEDFLDYSNYDCVFIDFSEEIGILDDFEYLSALELELKQYNVKDCYIICADFNGQKVLDKYNFSFKVISSPYTFLHRLQQWCIPYQEYFPLPQQIEKPFIYLGGRKRKVRDEFLEDVPLEHFYYSYGVTGDGQIDNFKRPQNEAFHNIGPSRFPSDAPSYLEMNYHLPSSYNKHCLFELVLETLPHFPHNAPNLFITEKSWKPFFSGNPQLIFGNPNTLKELRNAGFETFPEIFDESYDTEQVPEKRASIIQDNIKEVIKSPTSLYKKVYPKVVHNREHFLSLHIGSSWKLKHPLLLVFDEIYS